MITVIMTTYAPIGGEARAEYTKICVNSLLENIRSPMPLRLHIADDGSADNHYIKDVMIKASKVWGTPSSCSNAKHRGIGASLNKALQLVGEYWLYTTDDWKLTQKLYLAPAIKLVNLGYDMVRLGPIHPNLKCMTKFNQDIGWWLDVSTETGFAFATRPFLAAKSLTEKIGPFDEGLNAYEVERYYAERIARRNVIQIAFDGSQTLAGSWEHIGEYEVGDREVSNK